MVARLGKCNASSGCFDDTRAFVAGHHWKVPAPFAPDQMHIAMADSGSSETDFHFARSWRVEIHLFDDQGLPKGITDCCFHQNTSQETAAFRRAEEWEGRRMESPHIPISRRRLQRSIAKNAILWQTCSWCGLSRSRGRHNAENSPVDPVRAR